MLAAALFAAAGAWNFAAPGYTVYAPAAPAVHLAPEPSFPVVYAAPAPAPRALPSGLPMIAVLAAGAMAGVAAAGLVGTKVKAVQMHTKFGAPADDTRVNLADRCNGKKVILVGLPGAFTPT